MSKKIVAAAVALAVGSVMSSAALAGETTISGKTWFQFLHKKTAGSDATNGFQVPRFYLSIDHRFDDIWSMDLTTDLYHSSNDNHVNVYVKKAYVQAAVNPAAKFRFGSADMPWIPYAEHAYGFRYVQATLTDRNHFANSADWGAHMLGKVGMFDYQLSVVNGGGYKDTSFSKSVDFAGRVGVSPVKGLKLALGGYNGKLNQDTPGSSGINTATRYDLLAAYHTSMFGVGGEYFSAKDWKTGTTSDKADGFSVYGDVTPIPSWTIFARYDEVKPNKDTHPDYKNKFYNVGVQYEVMKNIKVAVAYQRDKFDNQTPDKQDEIGLYSEVKF